MRRVLVLTLVFLVVCGLWHAVNRLRAGRQAVRVQRLESPIGRPTDPYRDYLTLACFNIAHGRGTNESQWSARRERNARLGAIADLLRAEEVDIAVLNEVDFAALWSGHQDQAAFIAERGGFPYLATQRNLDVSLPGVRIRFGNAILSTVPIESAALVPYRPYSVTESLIAGSKQGMYTDLVVKSGKRMRVLAVHLENRDAATREAAAAEILGRARASPAPFFALGDFNAPRADHLVHQHGWLAPTAVDRLLESGLFQTRPVQAPRREELTWPSWAPNRAIDWILVPLEWTILSHRVVATDLSDHCLVLMEVRPRAGWE